MIDDFGGEEGTGEITNELILAHVYSGYSIGLINGFFELVGGATTFETMEGVGVSFCLSEAPEEAPEEAVAQENDDDDGDDDKESGDEKEPGAVCFNLTSEGI